MWKRSDEVGTEVETPPTAPSQSPPQAARRQGQVSVLGRSLRFEGRLSGEEDLVVEGNLNGEISLPGHQVTIGPQGRVEAEVRASAIIVEGEVHGNVSAEQQVVVRASGKVHGDIRAPRVALDQGCRFKGTIDMEPSRKQAGTEEAAAQGTRAPLPEPTGPGARPGAPGGPVSKNDKDRGAQATSRP